MEKCSRREASYLKLVINKTSTIGIMVETSRTIVPESFKTATAIAYAIHSHAISQTQGIFFVEDNRCSQLLSKTALRTEKGVSIYKYKDGTDTAQLLTRSGEILLMV